MTKRETTHREATPSEPEILVTGATGFIGRWLLAALTRRGSTVAALVRGAADRRAELEGFVARIGGDPSKLVVVEGDVEREGLGLERPLPSVRVVHHLAARFAWGLSREEARATNVEGTERVMRWAAAQPALDRFVFLGGYRMTAASREALAASIDARYAEGAYEGSKCEAYVLFRRLVDELDLSWSAVHPSGVIGDARTGETTQLPGLGETVQKLFERRLPALAGSARTFVPVVTVDYLAQFLATVPERRESAGEDLVVLDPASPPLPELVAMLARVLGVPAPRWTLPVRLVAALPTAWTGVHRESTRFLVEDRYDTREGDAHAAAMGLVHPPLEQALARWCAFLVSTRFLGRRDEPGRDEPGHDEPGHDEPGHDEPGHDEPGHDEPGHDEPGRYEAGTFVVGDPRTADVVLLHGIPFDGEAMAPLARALARSSARLDLPGLGRSGAGAIDVAWLRSRLAGRARPAVLVGHSLGAALATQYAAAYPSEVATLVLIAPSFLMAPPSWTLRLEPVVASVLGRLDPDAFERRFLSEREGPALAATGSAIAALARDGGARCYARALADAVTPRARAAAREAFDVVRERSVPTLIVHGDREPLAVDARGAAVVTIEACGHAPHLTHTEAVARHALGHLAAPRAATRELR
ncbi:MAG: alpha/beta fold hydrolase [Sandaracinaceae bacterium]|nr:alpha/beta fold hydrolase [Sandaracinaceae bacterium]